MPCCRSLKSVLIEGVLLVALIAVVGHLSVNFWERYIIQSELSQMKQSLQFLKIAINNIGNAYDKLLAQIKDISDITIKKNLLLNAVVAQDHNKYTTNGLKPHNTDFNSKDEKHINSKLSKECDCFQKYNDKIDYSPHEVYTSHDAENNVNTKRKATQISQINFKHDKATQFKSEIDVASKSDIFLTKTNPNENVQAISCADDNTKYLSQGKKVYENANHYYIEGDGKNGVNKCLCGTSADHKSKIITGFDNNTELQPAKAETDKCTETLRPTNLSGSKISNVQKDEFNKEANEFPSKTISNDNGCTRSNFKNEHENNVVNQYNLENNVKNQDPHLSPPFSIDHTDEYLKSCNVNEVKTNNELTKSVIEKYNSAKSLLENENHFENNYLLPTTSEASSKKTRTINDAHQRESVTSSIELANCLPSKISSKSISHQSQSINKQKGYSHGQATPSPVSHKNKINSAKEPHRTKVYSKKEHNTKNIQPISSKNYNISEKHKEKQTHFTAGSRNAPKPELDTKKSNQNSCNFCDYPTCPCDKTKNAAPKRTTPMTRYPTKSTTIGRDNTDAGIKNTVDKAKQNSKSKPSKNYKHYTCYKNDPFNFWNN